MSSLKANEGICFDDGNEASSVAVLDPTRPSIISPTPIRRVIEYCQKQIDANSDEALLWSQCKSLAQKALEPVAPPAQPETRTLDKYTLGPDCDSGCLDQGIRVCEHMGEGQIKLSNLELEIAKSRRENRLELTTIQAEQQRDDARAHADKLAEALKARDLLIRQLNQEIESRDRRLTEAREAAQ